MKANYTPVPEIKKNHCHGCTCRRNRTTLWQLCLDIREKHVPELTPAANGCRTAWTCKDVVWIIDTEKHRTAYIALKLTS